MNASLAPAAIPPQPAPSATVVAFLKRAPKLFIGGEWVEARSKERIPVMDPATGRQIASSVDANAEDVGRAVAAARAAFERGPWRDMLPVDRQALMWKLSDLIEKHADELAEIESLINGKTKTIARMVDMTVCRDYFRYMAGWATKICGETFDTSIQGPPGVKFHTYTRREPVGVVAHIVPWNFPLVEATLKLGPTLATGCTCVLKPAEQTPLTALRFAELIAEAGFPPGVVNVVTGFGETTGAALVAHPGVDKVGFTGSTAVGKLINKSATDTLKRVSLELGDNSPVIVFPDVDIDAVIGGAANAIFFNAGQVCCAGARLFAHKKVFDRIIEGVSAAAQAIRLGPGLDPRTEMGPLISREHQAHVLGCIETGRREGARVVIGGEAPSSPGYYVKPTVLTDIKPHMKVVREEIFGPVLLARSFEDGDDIAAMVNDTPFGLAASIWSNDVRTVQRLVPKVRAGTVWVNCHNFIDANMPFGGFKQSGLGRENGRAVLDAYTELKSVCMAY